MSSAWSCMRRQSEKFRFRNRFTICAAVFFLLVCSNTIAGEPPQQAASEFLVGNCADCHTGESAEGGLDLSEIRLPHSDGEEFEDWVRILDRVAEGEMPPAEYGDLPKQARAHFTGLLGEYLQQTQERRYAEEGRVAGRRLTNLQLERSLQHLLGIDLPLAGNMPEEPRSDGFATVADGQPMSHFQLATHLNIVDEAVDEAARRVSTPPDEWIRDFSASQLVRRRPRSRTREPELLDNLAVTWSAGITYYGRLPATTAPTDGWYRFTIRAKALNIPETGGVWCSVRRGLCVSSAPLLPWVGAFEATEELNEWTFETWLPKGHMLEVRPGDKTLKQGRFGGGQVGTGEGTPQNLPGIGIESVRMERFHRGPDDSTIRRMILGDVRANSGPTSVEQLQTQIRSLCDRAFRRPTSDEIAAPYAQVAIDQLANGAAPYEALRAGVRSICLSPRFLYFLHEEPEDPYAIASRLSYFLTNAPPDERLRKLAAEGQLGHPEVRRAEAERLLAEDGAPRWVEDFSAEWLDLRLIDFTQPDRRLYPNFDQIVRQSMVKETHLFLQTLLEEDRSVRELVQSDFSWLNSRLARYYNIPGVTSDRMQSIQLPPESRRGGLITQGAVLKVTANGTTTSPVVRGVWMCERILGIHVPPPPSGVPAIEPDIRGATGIRQLLDKHRSDSSCKSCHRRIDPPGFALENFDAAGRWRTHYGTASRRSTSKRAEVDSSGRLLTGESFATLEEFQQAAAAHPRPIARSVASAMITSATGAPVNYADRVALERILDAAADQDYGLRTLLLQVVGSSLFAQM